uniref:BRK domain-containing protein n=1 Tax=Caenorhabditis tropicalis TaxID=1561998 RepID=A0A1I7TBN2_9PELO
MPDGKKSGPTDHPVTKEPHSPSILKHMDIFQIMPLNRNPRHVGVCAAKPGTARVSMTALDFVWRLLKKNLRPSPKESERLLLMLSPNTLAVGFPLPGFTIGPDFHEFMPKVTNPDEPFYWTYQMISDNIQSFTFHCKGVDFLAGLYYYPPRKGHNLWIDNDCCLFAYTITAREHYPPKNRNLIMSKIQNNVYGRYCNRVGRRVLVNGNGGYNVHCEYDYHSTTERCVHCLECLVDLHSYKWIDPDHDDRFVQRILNLTCAYMESEEPTILVFDRTTGSLLDASKWPKMTEIEEFLEANPNCNVHINSALVAQIALDGKFSDRMGGNPKFMEHVAEANLIDMRTPRELMAPPPPAITFDDLGLASLNLNAPATSTSSESFTQLNPSTSDDIEYISDC